MVRASAMIGENGPSATAEWLTMIPDSPRGRASLVLPAADGARSEEAPGAQRAALHVIAAPALAKSPTSGAPLVGLTIILSRPPRPDEDSLAPLVTGGVVALSLTVRPTADELRRASAVARTGTAVPIFVRRAHWKLIDTATGEEFADAAIAGNSGDVALSLTVTREVALSLLAALAGNDTGLTAHCDVTFRAVGGREQHEASLRGSDRANGGQTPIVVITHPTSLERSVLLERSLADVLSEAAGQRPLDAIVTACSPGADGVLHSIGRRIAMTRDVAPITQRVGFAAVGDSVVAMPAVLKTSASSRISAQALAASDLAIKPSLLAHRWEVHDLVLHLPATAAESLPVLDGDAPLWPDRVDGARFWYEPEFVLVDPAPAATGPDAPFRFSFAVVGHDQQGRPGLEAKLRFTLRMGKSAATQAEWEARSRPRCDTVPTDGLSVALEVPFRDPNGLAATQMINATDIRPVDGGVVANFALTDQWARLAYGALGTEGFQTRRAQLHVSYVFAAYVPVREHDLHVLWGRKTATLNEAALRRPPLAAAALSVHHPVVAHPTLLTQPTVVHQAVLTHPWVVVPPKTYAIRTQGRSAVLDVFMPCSKFGALYVQIGDPQRDEADQAIGCRDAWTLGQIQLRLYEPVEVDVGVPDPGFSVFRSLQVPGRFLVLPKAYTITRFEPEDDARAYRPAVYLFSNVDAVHPEHTSCVLMATLRPAVTPANGRALVDALRTTAHPDPTLEWPTELAVEPRYTWAIPGDVVHATAKTPEGFQVSLTTNVDRILQLKAIVETSGLTASVVFPLPDATTLQSTLIVDLRRIDGPWEAGAVPLTIDGNLATLTNRVERAADVQDMLTYVGGARIGAVHIERRLEAGASLDVALPQGTDDAIVRYLLVDTPASLEEIRTFIEDIYTNVVFAFLFDLTAEHVQRVALEGRIVGIAGAAAAVIDASTNVSSGQMNFVLPLTVYLSQPTLQYRATFVAADGTARSGPWRDWRLDVRGNVVEIGKNELEEA